MLFVLVSVTAAASHGQQIDGDPHESETLLGHDLAGEAVRACFAATRDRLGVLDSADGEVDGQRAHRSVITPGRDGVVHISQFPDDEFWCDVALYGGDGVAAHARVMAILDELRADLRYDVNVLSSERFERGGQDTVLIDDVDGGGDVAFLFVFSTEPLDAMQGLSFTASSFAMD